jgi:hypothetical protein
VLDIAKFDAMFDGLKGLKYQTFWRMAFDGLTLFPLPSHYLYII